MSRRPRLYLRGRAGCLGCSVPLLAMGTTVCMFLIMGLILR